LAFALHCGVAGQRGRSASGIGIEALNITVGIIDGRVFDACSRFNCLERLVLGAGGPIAMGWPVLALVWVQRSIGVSADSANGLPKRVAGDFKKRRPTNSLVVA
jgi:hypothetical protein